MMEHVGKRPFTMAYLAFEGDLIDYYLGELTEGLAWES